MALDVFPTRFFKAVLIFPKHLIKHSYVMILSFNLFDCLLILGSNWLST